MTREATNMLNCQNMKNYAKRLDDLFTKEFLTGARDAKKENLTPGQLHQSPEKCQDVSKMFFLSLIIVFLILAPLCCI